jgi:large subunit ribosomal protein L23
MRDIYSVIKAPYITEKATFHKEMANQIVVSVDKTANKIEIKEAVEKMFKVKVVSVNTLKITGKPKRMGRFIGKRPDVKKAIVKLRPEDTIDFFSGVF